MKTIRIILILFFVLLPFHSVFAQTQEAWLIEGAHQARVFKEFVKPCKTARWSGAVDGDGYVTGKGTLQMDGDDGRKDIFTGTMKRGMPVEGRYQWIRGSAFVGTTYQGSYQRDLRNGKGTYLFADGKKYVGDFVNEKPHGKGILYQADGTIQYSGEWIAGLPASFAASPELMTLGEAARKDLLLVVVRPDYPLNALQWNGEFRRATGSGIFDLRFDYETGRLREVHVVKSIGQPQLDGHAIGALKLWKAKPRSIHLLRVPVTFTTSWR